MSTFIANTISFDPAFTTYALKGGDNNVFPRPNNWTREIPVTELLRDLDGGTIELTPGKAKNKSICRILNKYKLKFIEKYGELDYKDEHPKSIWHWPYLEKSGVITEEDQAFFKSLNDGFLAEIKRA